MDDVRVVEAGGELRLLDEHPDEGLVIREVRQDPLDDEHPLEAGRTLDAALEDLGHPAASDALEERVLAELYRLGKLRRHGGSEEGKKRASGAGTSRGHYMIAIS
jgi:hypothetical protein